MGAGAGWDGVGVSTEPRGTQTLWLEAEVVLLRRPWLIAIGRSSEAGDVIAGGWRRKRGCSSIVAFRRVRIKKLIQMGKMEMNVRMCGRGYKKRSKLGEEGSDSWIGLTGAAEAVSFEPICCVLRR